MNQSLQHLFSQIPRADIQRSVFDRHQTLKTAFNSGYLVPIFVDEALPGDTFSLNLSLFGRLSTMAVPILDNLYLETFFFAVPNRLLWAHWQQFCGEQLNPGDSTDYVIPVMENFTGIIGGLADYFGLPVDSHRRTILSEVNVLPFRAYNLIYNEWFRDENLCSRAYFSTGDGPDPTIWYNMCKRRKRHDYFTSCLPWPQKGPGVEIPIAGNAPVYGSGVSLALTSGLAYRSMTGGLSTLGMRTKADVGGTSISNYPPLLDANTDTTDFSSHTLQAGGGVYTSSGVPTKSQLGNQDSGLVADMSAVTATTINQLREAFQIQRLYEADARGGTRYTEILRAHFGVVSPDARLQRPEYLGGSSCRIAVHPVAQQSSTDSTSPQANLAAFATVGDVQHIFTKSFTEHCYILGLVNVRADLTYQQGKARMWNRRTRFDFYWPTLAHLGEQAVLNKEIYVSRAASDDDSQAVQHNTLDNSAFGYQERWAEYRYGRDMITGKLRSSAESGLDCWHLAQNFTSTPVLNRSFIEEDVPLSRVLAVTNEPQILLDADFDLKCARPMPVYSVPGLIDHF